jgi:hypothetical protein
LSTTFFAIFTLIGAKKYVMTIVAFSHALIPCKISQFLSCYCTQTLGNCLNVKNSAFDKGRMRVGLIIDDYSIQPEFDGNTYKYQLSIPKTGEY